MACIVMREFDDGLLDGVPACKRCEERPRQGSTALCSDCWSEQAAQGQRTRVRNGSVSGFQQLFRSVLRGAAFMQCPEPGCGEIVDRQHATYHSYRAHGLRIDHAIMFEYFKPAPEPQ